MSLPAISVLSRKYDSISFWGHSRVSDLIPVFFPSHKIYTDRIVKEAEFTTLLLMTNSFRSALYGYLSGIPERIGFRTDMRGFFLTKAVEPPSDRCHHHSADYLDLEIQKYPLLL